MSGHFVLKNISVSDQAIAVSAGANRSGLQHSEVGWNANSRGVLSNALQGRDIGDRAGLPPHRYLQFSYNNANMRDQTSRYLQGTSWADSLVRPDHMGLRNLAEGAATAWNEHKPNEAMLQQFLHGDSIVEVYYVSGGEIL
jgi:hypothetical protein